jgi:hypothetical protein
MEASSIMAPATNGSWITGRWMVSLGKLLCGCRNGNDQPRHDAHP